MVFLSRLWNPVSSSTKESQKISLCLHLHVSDVKISKFASDAFVSKLSGESCVFQVVKFHSDLKKQKKCPSVECSIVNSISQSGKRSSVQNTYHNKLNFSTNQHNAAATFLSSFQRSNHINTPKSGSNDVSFQIQTNFDKHLLQKTSSCPQQYCVCANIHNRRLEESTACVY